MTEGAAATNLEQLTPKARVHGILPTQPVIVVAIEWYGTNAVNVTYRDDNGGLGEALLYRDHELSLRVEQQAAAYAFDADPHLFKLASEALRIRMAAYFDPATSARCRTRSPPSTASCCRVRRCASCWPTTPAPAKRS